MRRIFFIKLESRKKRKVCLPKNWKVCVQNYLDIWIIWKLICIIRKFESLLTYCKYFFYCSFIHSIFLFFSLSLWLISFDAENFPGLPSWYISHYWFFIIHFQSFLSRTYSILVPGILQHLYEKLLSKNFLTR